MSLSSVWLQLLPLPEAYSRALRAKMENVGRVRSAIGGAGLDDKSRVELQSAIQAHFRVRSCACECAAPRLTHHAPVAIAVRRMQHARALCASPCHVSCATRV